MMTNGKFSGFLILSDLDGTFYNGEALELNVKAVERFISMGGRFSFATGRSAQFLKEKDFFSVINAPACLLNGGVVYDFSTEQILYERHLEFTIGEFLNAVSGAVENLEKICIFIDSTGKEAVLNGIICHDSETLNVKPIKIICVFKQEENALKFKGWALKNNFFKDSYISRSWSIGVEFNASNGTKGHALDFIKQKLGIHTAIGVGDFENDLELIKHADIGVAVGNAVDELKMSADWVVKPCREASIKDLIEKLEVEIDETNEKRDFS
jgi:HAD superfamily hydrolase (TIGR01484 family)